MAVDSMSEKSTDVEKPITQEESDVYDRQIRLWGIEAQNKLRHSRVLVVGLRGLGAEIAKNLVLCGLNAMHIVDPDVTVKDDLYSNFFLDKESVGKPRGSSSLPAVQALNPLVRIECPDSLDKVDVCGYSLVILADQPYKLVKETNEKCRAAGIPFIAASVYGWIGYAFLDCNGRYFLVKKERAIECVQFDEEEAKQIEDDTSQIVEDEEDKLERKKLAYSSFADALNVDWQTKKLIRKARLLLPSTYFPVRAMLWAEELGVLSGEENKDVEKLTELWKEELDRCNQPEKIQAFQPDKFEYTVGPQLSATAAVIGGFVAQEAIKALTEGKHPQRNLFFYSALDSSSRVCDFPPK